MVPGLASSATLKPPSARCGTDDRPPVRLFQLADADASGTINELEELNMLLSYLNLEPSEDCLDKLKELERPTPFIHKT